MTLQVPEILTKTAASKERVSPVDVVMGDHWGEIELGNSLRLSLLGLVLKKQQQSGGQYGTGGGGSPALRQLPFQIVRRGPQALVKVIRNGGTINARGMRDQMSYLEKDGDAKLERSESFFGIELDTEAQEDLIEAWGLDRPSNTNSDKTTHFVVSFPTDTNHDAAYRAGRAWAEEMFASGVYGDVYDYYTAFHIDRAHPHIHVVVNRRGIENGDWLKVSRRSLFNYEEFRTVQVEVAAREDIYLEASPRLARGLTDRPIPDAEIRAAEREKREAKPPAHTPVTAIRAAATIVLFAEQIEASASLISERYPVLSKTLQSMAVTIREGRQILADPGAKPIITNEEAKQQSEFIMSRRSEILNGIKTIDAELGTVPIGPERSSIERDTSRIKSEASQLMPDIQELRAHTAANENGYYHGISTDDPAEIEIKAVADQHVGALAEAAGIDPVKFVSRYEADGAASQGLADQWRKDELEDIQKNLTYRDAAPKNQIEELAQAAYDDLHRNALQTYRQAERELEIRAARRKDLYRIARLVRDGAYPDNDIDGSLRRTVKETLHSSELQKLENGDPEGLNSITQNSDAKRALGRRYLEAEAANSDGERRLKLETALARIDRQTDLPTNTTSRRDRDLDR